MLHDLKFVDLNKLNYLKYRNEISELYIRAFTTGEYAQFLDKVSVEKTMDELFNFVSGILVQYKNRIIGALIASPFSEHTDFPHLEFKDFDDDKTIYINELIVDSDFRGKGIAKTMINKFLKGDIDNCHFAVIRVWNKNIPAITLYKKMNFEPIAYITQTKLKARGEEFQMDKIYLYKKLITDD